MHPITHGVKGKDMKPQALANRPSTMDMNGKLWGARAKDWADIQEGCCQGVYEEALNKVTLGRHTAVLDVGCGAGMASQMAFEHGANVSGLDASPELLSIAQHRVPDGRFTVGDIECLPYDNGAFDIVMGFNSIQYAGNPLTALKEARRVAKQGATLIIATWGEPKNMEAASIVSALKPLLPQPPLGAPGPFALSEESALKSFALDAGLTPIEVFDVDSPWRYSTLEVALRGLRSSGVACKAIEHSDQSAVDDAHMNALLPFKQPGGSYKINARFRCLLAKV
jgi:SAM-dependent methyltransferase